MGHLFDFLYLSADTIMFIMAVSAIVAASSVFVMLIEQSLANL